MRRARSGSSKAGGSVSRGKGGVLPQSASPKDAPLSKRGGNKSPLQSSVMSPSASGGSVTNMRTPVGSRDGNDSSPGTPASRRKGGDTPRTPLTTLAASPNVAPVTGGPLHSPFFGAQGSPGWMLHHEGTPGLSDSVVSEQANYLVSEKTTITTIS